ncbi:hypothetical protein MN116_000570 [Schistosoma mekongi]|uniref:Reverse transcriptase domain-containing protein n=1 Tax=Schistosoma mekongi TaxID=38744 RepID=A0AAE1ZCK8_SCHME|nr:hypothetical protein MN116_000569 [Schistosoma mekongi]KAK4471059.1 hypothetical protein MN116_000570 [Schistosoma mekongi]
MSFGLRNAAQTFQRSIDDVFRRLDYVHAYVDDCLIPSPDKVTHMKHLDTVFSGLQQYGVTINIQKCQIGTTSLDFLGHTINANSIQPQKHKVAVILEYPEPTTIKQLRAFIGLVSFYRRFIPNSASIMQPQTDQLRGNKKVVTIDADSKKAYNATKEAIANVTMLAHHNTEASRLTHLNQSLAQFCDNGLARPGNH